METKKEDFMIIAPEGAQTLLSMGSRTFLIDCYTPLNLSTTFTHEELANDAMLQANLQDGNVIRYTGQSLPKMPNSDGIPILKEESSIKLETNYTQKTETKVPNFRVKTSTDISPTIKKDIQTRVIENKQALSTVDKKVLKTSPKVKSNIVEASSRETIQKSIDPSKLIMEVKMDVDPEEFQKRQEDSRKRLAEENRSDEIRVSRAIKAADEEENINK